MIRVNDTRLMQRINNKPVWVHLTVGDYIILNKNSIPGINVSNRYKNKGNRSGGHQRDNDPMDYMLHIRQRCSLVRAIYRVDDIYLQDERLINLSTDSAEIYVSCVYIPRVCDYRDSMGYDARQNVISHIGWNDLTSGIYTIAPFRDYVSMEYSYDDLDLFTFMRRRIDPEHQCSTPIQAQLSEIKNLIQRMEDSRYCPIPSEDVRFFSILDSLNRITHRAIGLDSNFIDMILSA